MRIFNYITLAFRNMRKYKIQSWIYILGLAFSISCLVPALYWIIYEKSYDSFYPDSNLIYRIYVVEKQSGKVNKGGSRIIEKKLNEQLPVIDASTAFMGGLETCRTEDMLPTQLNLLYADSSFLNVFPQVFLCGNTKQPLREMNNMILSETVALRLYGDVEEAIGQQIQNTINSSLPPYVVTAVVKDSPANTNLAFDAIVFHDMLKYFSELPEKEQWGIFFMDLYVKFNSYVDMNDIAQRLCDFPSEFGENKDIELRMIPIKDVRHHLNKEVPFTLNFIKLFILSGVLLLFTAIFNFVNLHFDLFLQRIREMRLRVVHGASRGQLIQQMLIELSCAIFLSLVVAYVFILCVSPSFARLLGIEIGISQMSVLFSLCVLGVVALILLFALVFLVKLSSWATSSHLEKNVMRKTMLRRIAVFVQLAASVIFIFSTSVVMLQMHFINQKDLGFDTQGMIQISGFQDYSGRIRSALIQELMATPQIKSVTDAGFEPRNSANQNMIVTDVEWAGKSLHDKSVFNYFLTDSRLVETFKLQMIKGEWWGESQTQKVVLNEEAARIMNFDEPIGSVIRMPSPDDGSMTEYEIVGIVNDFHTLSFRNPIQPTIFVSSVYSDNILYARVETGLEFEAMQQIRTVLSKMDVPMDNIRLILLSELYKRLNRTEQVGLKLFSVLTFVCLLIALLGIYVVASSSSHRRRKEIAIRKVAGASVSAIVRMFFKEYVILASFAGIMALPVAFLIMSNWLQEYTYRTKIPLGLSLGVLIGMITIVLLTVFGQVLKAANRNPAEVVKSE